MKKALFIAVGVIVLVAPALAVDVVFKKDKTVLPLAETAEFHSKNGYTITYPKDWMVDDSQKDAPAEFIREPNGKAFVAIQVGQDDRLKDSILRAEVFKEVEDVFKQSKQYNVEFFEWEPRDTKLDRDSYMAAGSYSEKDTVWRFKEIGVFTAEGTIFFFRGNVRAKSVKEYGIIVDKILFSFKP